MKRLLDITVAIIGLVLSAPFTVPAAFLIWLQDYHNPIYVADRVGLGERLFKMMKLRSMVHNAHKTGVDSTGANDKRITKVGQFIRRYKLDELTQLWNVLIGDMSVVGPRPNVKRETDLYTAEEKKLLSVRPGITDLSSIVFSDEGDILKDSEDPDLDYNQRIRPWKSRLGLFYIENRTLVLDIRIIIATAVAILNRSAALTMVHNILVELNAPEEMRQIALRQQPLKPFPPPGATEIVMKRA